MIAHAFKISSRLVARPEIDLSALIQDYGLVAHIIYGLGGLIDRNEGGETCKVCRDSEGANKLKSSL